MNLSDVPSSSLLQGKYLPFSPSPLCLNIFRLIAILPLTLLYRYTPDIFLSSIATFKYTYPAPSDKLDMNIQRMSHGLLFSHWNGYTHFRSGFGRTLLANQNCTCHENIRYCLYSALEQLSVFKRLTLHLRGDDHDGNILKSWRREKEATSPQIYHFFSSPINDNYKLN